MPTKKQPTFRYLLCLIPLVGFFAGIYFLYQGIFTGAGKRSIVYGVMGMLFSVLLYGFLVYQTEMGSWSFNESNKVRMQEVVNVLNRYKVKEGTYPDSLEQLIALDRLAPIDDLFLLRRPRASKTTFFYERKADTFVLFSTGLDRLAFTKDDVVLTGHEKDE